jgi:DNA-binding CsgD family transcriptional regulator
MDTGKAQVIGLSMVVPVTVTLDEGDVPPMRRKVAALFVVDDRRMRLIRTFMTARQAIAAAARSYGVLTRREREIMSLLAEGLTTQQVAGTLFLSVLTVRTHVRNAKEKLGARTTYHAIAIALQDGDDPSV